MIATIQNLPILISKQITCNTQNIILEEFDKNLSNEKIIEGSLRELVLQINKQKASKEFAKVYLEQATDFIKKIRIYRKLNLKKRYHLLCELSLNHPITERGKFNRF